MQAVSRKEKFVLQSYPEASIRRPERWRSSESTHEVYLPQAWFQPYFLRKKTWGSVVKHILLRFQSSTVLWLWINNLCLNLLWCRFSECRLHEFGHQTWRSLYCCVFRQKRSIFIAAGHSRPLMNGYDRFYIDLQPACHTIPLFKYNRCCRTP